MIAALSPTYMFGLSLELSLFVRSVLMGILFGVIFDMLRVVRIIIPHKNWLVFAEDFLFMLFCGFWFFIFSMTSARGQLRAFLLIGSGIGFVLYIVTIGAVVKRVVTKTRDVIRAVLKRIYMALKRLLTPLAVKIRKHFKLHIKKFPAKRKKIKKTAKKVLKV